jgi:Family of unknown function (DUF695)
MRVLFGKKKPSLDSLPVEDLWSLAQGTDAGAPIVIRANSSAKGYAPHPEMPVRLGIAVPLHAPDDRGLPTAEEAAQLGVVEEALFEAVNHAHIGRVVLVITTGGMREWVSYVRTQQDGRAAASQVRSAVSDHEVQHYTADDKQWSVYRQFA